MPASTNRLEKEFGGTLPPGLAALAPADQDRLCDAIEATRKRQRKELRESTERGLDFIPRLLRAPIKKALFG